MPEPDVSTASDGSSGGSGTDAWPLVQYLFVVLSCDTPLEGGSRHSLTNVDVVVFRRGDLRSSSRRTVAGLRQLDVSLPGRQVSSTHARLVRVSSRWTIEDSDSTNGVFVNGRRVERETLVEGDVVEIGRTVLLYREAVPTPDKSPLDLDTRDLAPSAEGMSSLVPTVSRDLSVLANAARSTLPLLLLGETGTGKEVLARAVHRLSGRRGALLAVNCGAIPESLLEGQLFGHVRGAFSGAVRDEVGLVRSANGGTLFLDEIGDLPSTSQAALLRVLQEGEVQPVGSSRSVKVDLRVVAATHRSLVRLAQAERFRSDLYARLNGFSHTLPPLRERVEDLPILFDGLLRRILPGAGSSAITLAPASVRAMLAYDWPLNIRELQQALARAVVVSEGQRIDLSHLPTELREARAGEATSRDISAEDRLDYERRRELIRLLGLHGANVSEVARAMGKARMQIHRWMKRYGLDAGNYRR